LPPRAGRQAGEEREGRGVGLRVKACMEVLLSKVFNKVI